MQVHVSNDAPTSVVTGALVVPIFAGGAVDGVAAEVDTLLGGAIADILAGGEISGKANETSLVHAKDAPFKRVLVVGLGARDAFNATALAKYAGTAVRYLGKRGIKAIAISVPSRSSEASPRPCRPCSRRKGSRSPRTCRLLSRSVSPHSNKLGTRSSRWRAWKWRFWTAPATAEGSVVFRLPIPNSSSPHSRMLKKPASFVLASKASST